jgi:hypothetical protein
MIYFSIPRNINELYSSGLKPTNVGSVHSSVKTNISGSTFIGIGSLMTIKNSHLAPFSPPTRMCPRCSGRESRKQNRTTATRLQTRRSGAARPPATARPPAPSSLLPVGPVAEQAAALRSRPPPVTPTMPHVEPSGHRRRPKSTAARSRPPEHCLRLSPNVFFQV